MALKRIWMPSPNKSSRGGSGVRLVVIHTAEGARSFRDLGGFFANASAQASSHVGIDDERGTIGEYVRRADKAWTQANYNPQCVSVELCAAPISSSYPCGANWSADEWNRHDGMLANLADWIREECAFYGLPIEKLSSGAAQGSGRGVCGHNDLGAGGGGHWDPGPNFPWTRVMDMARGGDTAPPPQPMLDDDAELFTVLRDDGCLETFARDSKGQVWHAWQTAENAGWKGSEPGKDATWYSLGTPGG